MDLLLKVRLDVLAHDHALFTSSKSGARVCTAGEAECSGGDVGVVDLADHGPLAFNFQQVEKIGEAEAGDIVGVDASTGGSADDIFYHPSHPYTVGLLGATGTFEIDQMELQLIPREVPLTANLVPNPDFHAAGDFALDGDRVRRPAVQPRTARACGC